MLEGFHGFTNDIVVLGEHPRPTVTENVPPANCSRLNTSFGINKIVPVRAGETLNVLRVATSLGALDH